MASITTWATAIQLDKLYLTYMVFEHLLMQVYVGDFSGTFINVKIELRKPFTSTKGDIENTFHHQCRFNLGIGKYKPMARMNVML
ncbi:hypothetical protein [Candidatus Enterovibrio escicola]|uniref:hypothetical protein n=1 Tax=Candidatus Enterovibrio escicola TaxID=1927127 RepID=UPI0030DBFA61